MANPEIAKLSAAQEKNLGLVPGTKFWSPAPFAGMNTSASRPFIDDKEFSYIENWIKVGEGNYRTAWDMGKPLYTTTTKTIVLFFWFNIGQIDYAAIFFSDGTAIQVQESNGVVTSISATANTFYTSGSSLPVCCQSGAQYLLIANNITPNAYWIWDGTLLYQTGSVGPVVDLLDGGAGYTSAPTVTAFGGSGSGVAATAAIADGSVVTVTITDTGAGFLPGDIVQFAFSGGGSDSSAILEAVLTAGTLGGIELIAPGTGYTTGTYQLGFLGGGIPGATGYITFSVNPSNLDTITLNGQSWTFVSGSPSANETQIGLSLAATLIALQANLAASTDADLITASYSVTTTVLNVAYFTGGAAGNAYTLAASAATPSGGTLTGGSGTVAKGTFTVAGGIVTAINLSSPGAGYTGTPTLIFLDGSGGTGAKALAILSAGSVASVTVVNGGTNFTGTPLITFVGGGGTGATGIVVLTSGVITSVTVTDGGMNYTSAPAVEVQTGFNNAAAATAELMPYGVSGSSMETFDSRVWLPYPNEQGKTNNGGIFLVSTPESLTDFSPSDGGLVFTSTDRFLRKQYVNIRQSNGYLYPFGDSSISVISNVSTGGSPPDTTFNYQNVDPQVGAAWRDSVQDFSTTILFANSLGVYGVYGGRAQKISKNMDDIFLNAIIPPTAGALLPSSASASIFNVKHYLLLMTITSPQTGLARNVMLSWNEKEWGIQSQSSALTYIATQEVASDLMAWGTDGKSLFPLFNAPSATLAKTFSTKLYGAQDEYMFKDLLGVYLQAQDKSSPQVGIECEIDVDIAGMAVQPSDPNLITVPSTTVLSSNTNAIFNQPSFQAPPPYWPVFGTGTGGIPGLNIGLTVTTTSPDFAMANLILSYKPIGAYQ